MCAEFKRSCIPKKRPPFILKFRDTLLEPCLCWHSRRAKTCLWSGRGISNMAEEITEATFQVGSHGGDSKECEWHFSILYCMVHPPGSEDLKLPSGKCEHVAREILGGVWYYFSWAVDDPAVAELGMSSGIKRSRAQSLKEQTNERWPDWRCYLDDLAAFINLQLAPWCFQSSHESSLGSGMMSSLQRISSGSSQNEALLWLTKCELK